MRDGAGMPNFAVVKVYGAGNGRDLLALVPIHFVDNDVTDDALIDEARQCLPSKLISSAYEEVIFKVERLECRHPHR